MTRLVGDIVGPWESPTLLLEDRGIEFIGAMEKDGAVAVIRYGQMEKLRQNDLLGRLYLKCILFHHLGNGMKDIRRFIHKGVSKTVKELYSVAPDAVMIGVPTLVDLENLEKSLPVVCTVDLSHIIVQNPTLFERLKPYLKGNSFELTEDLYFELKLAL